MKEGGERRRVCEGSERLGLLGSPGLRGDSTRHLTAGAGSTCSRSEFGSTDPLSLLLVSLLPPFPPIIPSPSLSITHPTHLSRLVVPALHTSHNFSPPSVPLLPLSVPPRQCENPTLRAYILRMEFYWPFLFSFVRRLLQSRTTDF
jgi:hypothetical protein